MPPSTGPVPEVLSQGFDAGRFGSTVHPQLGLSAATTGTWKVPVILVDFSDQRLTFTSAADWTTALFDTTGSTPTGSVFDYYRSVSGGRLRVVGIRPRSRRPRGHRVAPPFRAGRREHGESRQPVVHQLQTVVVDRKLRV